MFVSACFVALTCGAFAQDAPLTPHTTNARSVVLPNPLEAPAQGVGGRLTAPDNTWQGGGTNLSVIQARMADAAGNIITSIPAGESFWVRVDFAYNDAVCTPYQIARTVNGYETHLAPAITWGCGDVDSSWFHFWGAWVMHNEGVYSATVTLDDTNQIAETNELDNSVTLDIVVTSGQTDEWELVDVDLGRSALSEGTGVIVGTMDDAFDYLHPWFTGVDSNGQPRLVGADQNALGVGGSPVNADHATAVMGIVLARGLNDGDITGHAPDARYATSEFINRANVVGLPVLDVRDAAGFLVDQGADVINMSWSWWSGSNSSSQSGEGSVTNLMVDYLSYGENIVCVPAVNQLGFATPTAPGAARNVITVAGLTNALDRIWTPQDDGPTLDGRAKPEIAGNDSANGVAPNAAWRAGFPATEGFAGTSFAAPFVTGAVAQMIGFDKAQSRAHDHRVIKAVVTNSGRPVLRHDGAPWIDNTLAGLDNEQGAGLYDTQRIVDMYTSDAQSPGPVETPGHSLGTITGFTSVDYALGTSAQTGELRVTLATSRPTFWLDGNDNESIDSFDTFFTSGLSPMENFDIELLRNGSVVATSSSSIDSVEHIRLASAPAGDYVLRVTRAALGLGSPVSEPYGLAWWSDADFTPPACVGSSFDALAVGVLAGSSGVPVLEGTGCLVAGESNALALTSAKPLTSTFLVAGLTRLDAPLKGGVLVPSPDTLVPLLTTGAGEISLPFVWPSAVPSDVEIFFQAWINDAAGPSGFAASNGIVGTTE